MEELKKRREYKPPKGRFAVVHCARDYGKVQKIREQDYYIDNPKRNWFLHKKKGDEYRTHEAFPIEKKWHPQLLRGKPVPVLKKEAIFEVNKSNKPAPKKPELKFHYTADDKPLKSVYN